MSDIGRVRSASFEVRGDHNGGLARLRLTGELDMTSGELFDRALRSAERHSPRALVVDVRALAFMDSTGLAALLRAHSRAEESGRALAVVGAHGVVRKLLDISGLERLFRTAEAAPFAEFLAAQDQDWQPFPIEVDPDG